MQHPCFAIQFAGATHKRKKTAKVNLQNVEIRYWISVSSPPLVQGCSTVQTESNKSPANREHNTLYRSSIEIESIMYIRARFLESPLLPRVMAVAHKHDA